MKSSSTAHLLDVSSLSFADLGFAILFPRVASTAQPHFARAFTVSASAVKAPFERRYSLSPLMWLYLRRRRDYSTVSSLIAFLSISFSLLLEDKSGACSKLSSCNEDMKRNIDEDQKNRYGDVDEYVIFKLKQLKESIAENQSCRDFYREFRGVVTSSS
ncbi:unnamed protein product [Vicia faba]|uniref:Uncharacterized protein n=1 Tax=Vicia faba TaxID=3906 RepID=A0AAV1AYI0_VICFA|nr:unnamed protein product [Vicia faba]